MRKLLSLFLAVTLFLGAGCALAEGGYKDIGPFSEGLAAVQNEDGSWGYIDKTGVLVISCEWRDAQPFTDGVARVQRDRKYGFIDASGNLVIPCEYAYAAAQASEGKICVRKESILSASGVLNTVGEVIVPFEWTNTLDIKFSEGLAAVHNDDGDGYVNADGELVIPNRYSFGNIFRNGYALVQDEDGLFFINTAGEEAFPQFARAVQADTFRDDGIGLLGFSDGTIVFINTNGEVVCNMPEGYSSHSNFVDGLAGVGYHNAEGEIRCGYMDMTGTLVISDLYMAQRWFKNGRVAVSDRRITEDGVRYGVIDKTGTLVYPFELEQVGEFDEIVATAIKDGLAGAIDVDGNVVVPFEYTKTEVGDGVVICLKDNQVYLFDYSGNALN